MTSQELTYRKPKKNNYEWWIKQLHDLQEILTRKFVKIRLEKVQMGLVGSFFCLIVYQLSWVI